MNPPPPEIPAQWPAWSCRRALLQDAADGWCACCDSLPVRVRTGPRRFTCGQPGCRAEWAKLCQRDSQRRLYLARKVVAPFKAQMGRRANR